MDKIELLKAIYDKLAEVRYLLEVVEYSDRDIDDIYGSLSSTIDTVTDIMDKEQA